MREGTLPARVPARNRNVFVARETTKYLAQNGLNAHVLYIAYSRIKWRHSSSVCLQSKLLSGEKAAKVLRLSQILKVI